MVFNNNILIIINLKTATYNVSPPASNPTPNMLMSTFLLSYFLTISMPPCA